MMARAGWWVLACGVAALLGGCEPAQEDLRQWMAEQRHQMVPKVTPLAEPKKYVPQDYTESAAADPFGHERLTQALRRESGVKGSGDSLIAPELNRRKEPLEAFPLDAMSMVGSLDRGGKRVALVRVDKLLYQVKVGDYLGAPLKTAVFSSVPTEADRAFQFCPFFKQIWHVPGRFPPHFSRIDPLQAHLAL